MDINWKLLSKKTVYEGYRKVERRTYKMPDGSCIDWEVAEPTMEVTSIFALTDDGKVVITKEYRPGPGKIMWDFPGGIVDEGETALRCAKRELIEEASFSGNFEFVGKSYISAYSGLVVNSFVATDCKKLSKEIAGSNGEFISVELITLAELLKKIDEGLVTDMNTVYFALKYLKDKKLI